MSTVRGVNKIKVTSNLKHSIEKSEHYSLKCRYQIKKGTCKIHMFRRARTYLHF